MFFYKIKKKNIWWTFAPPILMSFGQTILNFWRNFGTPKNIFFFTKKKRKYFPKELVITKPEFYHSPLDHQNLGFWKNFRPPNLWLLRMTFQGRWIHKRKKLFMELWNIKNDQFSRTSGNSKKETDVLKIFFKDLWNTTCGAFKVKFNWPLYHQKWNIFKDL